MATRRRRNPATVSVESGEAVAPTLPEVEVVEPASAEEPPSEVAVELVDVVEASEVDEESLASEADEEVSVPSLRATVQERGQRFIDWLRLAQQELTTENVHQMRVSSRRFSSTLGLLGALVGEAPIRKLRQEIRAARRCLGGLRDLQRQLEWLADEPLLDEYLTEVAADLPKVVKKASKKLAKVSVRRLEKRLENVDGLLAALLEEDNAEEVVRELVSRHIWESLLRAMSHAEEVDPDHSFSYHPFRIALKTFRYQAEVYQQAGWRSQLDESDGWAKLKELHEALGQLQDLEVLSCHLDHHWAAFPPIRDAQGRIVNRMLKDRNGILGHIHLHDLDWESLWEWPQAEAEEAVPEETGAEE